MPAHRADDRADPEATLVDHPAVGRDYRQPSRPTGGSGAGKVLAIVAGTLAVVAVIGVAVYFLAFADSGEDAQAEYRGKVNVAMEEVVSANEDLSDRLGALRTRNSPAAERAVERARTATSSARGAVNALTVPEGSEQLATNARQTLSREASYLTAVEDALDNPAGGSAGQVQTLEGNLTDAFDVVAPPTADWSRSVSGADTLSAWARRNRAARPRPRARRGNRESARPETSPTATPAPASGSDCGGGVRAGPNTSCAFARNVRDAYNEAPGAAATVEVFSPTTGRTYTMNCRPAGSGITCSGGNSASVSF